MMNDDETKPCPVCQGLGLTELMPDGHEVECSHCEGSGEDES